MVNVGFKSTKIKMQKDPKIQKIEPAAETNELIDTIKRIQAEFENYKKRVEREKSEFVKFANEELIKKLLPLLDSFEQALKSTADKEKFVKGVELIYAQAFSTLEQEGLKKIEAVGKKFDPYKHEALLKEKSEKEAIIEEMQAGYQLNGKVIRTSKVKIGVKE